MKKFTLALMIAVMMLAVVGTSVLAGYQGYVISATFYGGQTNNRVGYTKIWNDADSLNVFFMMRGGAGWCLTDFHVHAGKTLADFPFTKSGNLKPGQFDFKADLTGCVQSSVLEIPLSDLADRGILPGDEFFMAIHGVAFNIFTGQEETAWSVRCGDLDGQQFPDDSSWAGYVRFTPDAWYLFP